MNVSCGSRADRRCQKSLSQLVPAGRHLGQPDPIALGPYRAPSAQGRHTLQGHRIAEDTPDAKGIVVVFDLCHPVDSERVDLSIGNAQSVRNDQAMQT
jgi:hypothetical protein